MLLDTLWLLACWIVSVHSQATPISTTWPASRFIGYYVAPDSVQALLAKTSWITSATYAGDCTSTGRCAVATQCAGGTLYYDDDSTLNCGELTCVKMTIFATSPNILPSAYNYACRQSWLANTVYRELPASTTSSSLSVSSTSLPVSTNVGPTPSNTDVSTASVSASPSPEPSSTSKAWIAGAVIGPVVGISLIAAVIFWWKKRSRKATNVGPAYETGYAQDQPEYQPVQQQVAEKHSFVRPAELPNEQQPSELPATRY